jgi:tRNA threonylcarbamoyladenosine biosynthesis protein TsaB
MILYLDCASESVSFEIYNQKRQRIAHKIWQSYFNQTELLLLEIKNFLDHHHIGLDDFLAIAVNPGPGTYTGLRVGITTGNFIAFSKNIPIYAIDASEIPSLNVDSHFTAPVEPKYQNLPFITKPKARF